MKTKAFEKCPVCGGDLQIKEVEKILRGGNDTVVVRVTAEVCLHCGEKMYSEEVIRSFEEIRKKLRKRELSHLRSVGQAFTIDKWHNTDIKPAALSTYGSS